MNLAMVFVSSCCADYDDEDDDDDGFRRRRRWIQTMTSFASIVRNFRIMFASPQKSRTWYFAERKETPTNEPSSEISLRLARKKRKLSKDYFLAVRIKRCVSVINWNLFSLCIICRTMNFRDFSFLPAFHRLSMFFSFFLLLLFHLKPCFAGAKTKTYALHTRLCLLSHLCDMMRCVRMNRITFININIERKMLIIQMRNEMKSVFSFHLDYYCCTSLHFRAGEIFFFLLMIIFSTLNCNSSVNGVSETSWNVLIEQRILRIK